MSTVCVMGATGAQGGSVCAALLKDPSFKVRAITRNPDSASAKKLAEQGAEVVAADADDEASLAKAFEGASAVFALTDYNWDLVMKAGRDAAGEAEKKQHINIAKAAAQTPTLTHYVMSSLPPADLVSGGKLKVPHFDYKHAAYQWIESNLPVLAAKTTLVWLGWYPINMAHNPMMKPFPVPNSPTYIWPQPSRPSALLPIAGDVSHNVGVIVSAILRSGGAKTHGKIAIVVTEYRAMRDALQVWADVAGRRAAFAEMTDEAAERVWGVAGLEIAAQLRWSEEFPDWGALFPERVVSFEELGVEGELRGFREALEGVGEFLV